MSNICNSNIIILIAVQEKNSCIILLVKFPNKNKSIYYYKLNKFFNVMDYKYSLKTICSLWLQLIPSSRSGLLTATTAFHIRKNPIVIVSNTGKNIRISYCTRFAPVYDTNQNIIGHII